jgi:hypothetical protein
VLIQMAVVFVDHLRRPVAQKRSHHRTRETISQGIGCVGMPQDVGGDSRKVRDFVPTLGRKFGPKVLDLLPESLESAPDAVSGPRLPYSAKLPSRAKERPGRVECQSFLVNA